MVSSSRRQQRTPRCFHNLDLVLAQALQLSLFLLLAQQILYFALVCHCTARRPVIGNCASTAVRSSGSTSLACLREQVRDGEGEKWPASEQRRQGPQIAVECGRFVRRVRHRRSLSEELSTSSVFAFDSKGEYRAGEHVPLTSLFPGNGLPSSWTVASGTAALSTPLGQNRTGSGGVKN